MAKLTLTTQTQTIKAVFEPEEDDLLAVLKFTRKTFAEDIKVLGHPNNAKDPDTAATKADLKKATAAIDKVLWFYTVGGRP